MEAIRIFETIEKDGEIVISGLPLNKGQSIEIIVLQKHHQENRHPLTVGQIRRSGLIGMWRDREDIADGATYARRLRGVFDRNDWRPKDASLGREAFNRPS